MKEEIKKNITNVEISEEAKLLFEEMAMNDFRNFRLSVLAEKIKSQGYRPKSKMLYY